MKVTDEEIMEAADRAAAGLDARARMLVEALLDDRSSEVLLWRAKLALLVERFLTGGKWSGEP